jgi:16S rRNA (cytosine967-C5)-methyltransferase
MKRKPHPQRRKPSPSGLATVRRLAIEALVESEASRRFIDDVLPGKMGALSPRDRHLLQEITFGSLRHQGTLDRLFKPYLTLRISRQRPAVRWAMRLGGYQLVYLGRVPAHAAVNQTLEGLKGIDGVSPRDIGFLNAVLHRLSADIRRKAAEPPLDRDDPTVLPIRDGFCHFSRPVLPLYRLDLVDHLAMKHSHPGWMVARWLPRHGEDETRQLLEANNRAPLLTARITARASGRESVLESLRAEGFSVEAGPLPASFRMQGGGELAASRAFQSGWFQVQDLTAQEIGAALRPPAGATVLDLCSSPGGKAAQLLEAVGPEGHVVATDQSDEKLVPVRENLGRLGANFTLVALPDDPERIELGRSFTHILLDAPCSNTGVLARRPEARWRLRREQLAELAELQSKLLEAAFRHLAPGGRLLYATCSIEPEENEEQSARFTRAHPELVELESRLFLPHRTGADGGYCSLLRRGIG